MLSCLFFFVSAHRLCAWLSKEEREQANASSPFHLTEHAVFVCMARRDRDALLVCRARRIRLYVQTDSVTIDQVTCPACPFRFLCVASASVCDRQQRGKVRRIDERARPRAISSCQLTQEHTRMQDWQNPPLIARLPSKRST